MDKKPTALERIADSLPAQLGVTAIAAASGTVFAALLPVLTSTLAHGRAQKRIEAVIQDLQAQLADMQDEIQSLSDAQYRLVGGALAAILETIDEEKLRLLKTAVLNVAKSDFLGSFEAQLFSRILRDISAAEVRFLAEHDGRPWISFGSPERAAPFHTLEPTQPLFVDKNSADGAVAVGLINMGLIIRSTSEGTMSDNGAYVMSPLVEKLLALVLK